MTANQIKPILDRLDDNDRQHKELRKMIQEVSDKIGPVIIERDHVHWLQGKTKNFFLNIGILATFIVSSTIIFKAFQWTISAGKPAIMRFLGD